MDKLVQFGTSDDVVYLFDSDTVAQVSTLFGDNTPLTVAVPGVDGAYNVGGRSAARSAIGNVQAFLWLKATDSYNMEAKRREIAEMLGWGEQRLFKRAGDNTLLWTWALVNNVQMSQSANNRPHRLQQVQMNFQAFKARWYGKPDDALSAAGAYTEGAVRSASNSVGNGSTVVVTNNGNAPAGVKITWTIASGRSVLNPRVARRDSGGNDVEYVQYTGTLTGAMTWSVDARNHRLLWDGSTTDFEGLTVITSTWLTLLPGANTLHISGTFTGGNATLDVDYWDTYF